MKTIITSFALAVLFALASCQKDDNSVNAPRSTGASNNQEINTSPQNDLNDQNDLPQLKISSSTILNASNANQIPSQFFQVGTSYKNNYTFIVQPDNSSCSWTSFVTAVGCIARTNGYSYPATSSKVYNVKNRCLSITNQNLDKAKYITTLASCANQYDNNYVYAQAVWKDKYSSGRFAAIKAMLSHINSYHTPFLVVSTFYYASGAKSGHYLVVLSIDWKQGGNGSTVYYTDCGYGSGSSLNSSLRSMNLTTFLDRMIDAPDNYNMVFFQPN